MALSDLRALRKLSTEDRRRNSDYANYPTRTSPSCLLPFFVAFVIFVLFVMRLRG
jgi:hypothetical protein